MPRHLSKGGRGGFTLPRKTIRKTPQEVQKAAEQRRKAAAEAAAKAEAAKARAAKLPEGPSKRERKRLARRKQLVAEGKLEETTSDVEELTKLTRHVVLAAKDCQDEVELRAKFRSGGTAGEQSKYFFSTRYRFRYVLAKDGTPVAQVVDKTPWA
uniref:Uncharacterized protein n=1 Tax=Zooxanthella nutricula TaxID=1333877 RepID=A0A6V0BZY0_9DINO|mmetsp:Transcript_33672/g.101661  ORF Transcript_33672/g.101661 Transcript_33672/m.101661 type:complete len:155 (+) Transcript_33672:62-526(+)